MMTMRQFGKKLSVIPTTAVWLLGDLADLKEKGEVACRGKDPAARWRCPDSKGTTLK